MKAISASIVILAAALLIVGGAFYSSHMGMQALTLLAGVVLCLAGLWGWIVGMTEKQ